MNDTNRTFINLFWSYAMIIIIPVFVLGFLTINILFKNLASDTENLNMNIIEQSSNIIDTEMRKTVSLFLQVEADQNIQEFILQQANGYETNSTYEIYDIIHKLKLHKTNNSVSQQIGFYISNTGLIITDSAFYEFDEFYETVFLSDDLTKDDLQNALDISGLKIDFISGENSEKDVIIMCSKAMNIGGVLNNATLFAIFDKNTFMSELSIDGTGSNHETAIIDKDKNIIVKSDNFDEKCINKTNGKNIIEVKSSDMNGSYIYTLPKGGLAGNVGYITVIFLLLMITTVVISVFLAYLHMQKMKKIILGVFNESKGLEDSLTEQLENAKERILSNLLHNIRVDGITNTDSMTKYGLNFSEKFFTVMTLTDTQTDGNDVFSSVEENAWTELNAILKQKISEKSIICEIVRTGSNSYSYILNYDTAGTTERLTDLPADILKNYNISITAGIGDETDTPEKLYSSYESSVSALRFGLNEKPGEIVFYKDISNLENEKIYYTVEKEKQLIRNIKLGSESNVNEILDEIYNVNFKERHISHSMMKRLIFNLSLTVYKILDEAYELDVEKHERYGRVCQNIFRNDNSDECFAILKEICLSLCNEIGKKTGEDAIKDQIVDYIASNYSNDSLSLEVLAEHLEISYHYLSRLFKEYLGTNFVSYLTLIRLEKAKELLKTTDDTIELIAEKTGFVSSNSLIRAFKKYYDITPGKYRKS